jgi:hypothetical protein
VLEFHGSKSVERDVDILRAVNANSDGVGEIYRLLTHMRELQESYAGNLLALDPILVDKESEMKGAKPNEVMQSYIAKAMLLVQPDIQETVTDEFAAKANRMKVDGSVIRKLRT